MIGKDQLNGYGIARREKLILAGLYLSKYGSLGYKRLGFDSFVEAFNVFGFALGAKPASVKNYRDEFDPLFPNERKGWHKRKTRDYCLAVFEKYKYLDFNSFTGVVRSFFPSDSRTKDNVTDIEITDEASSFAQRLITGAAAEQYFESIYAKLPEFSGYNLENTTRFGCGYDFRLRHFLGNNENFLAVEVKGLKGETGSLTMTAKEYDLATNLRGRFYLFVVKNFRETPHHEVYSDPLSSSLKFKKIERITIQVAWTSTV